MKTITAYNCIIIIDQAFLNETFTKKLEWHA